MKTKKSARAARRAPVSTLLARDVASLRRELARRGGREMPRWDADPDDVQRSVARLVLALVEFVRQLLERQALRRMDERTLTRAEVERMGRSLMELEKTVHDLARRFGLTPEDLNLDLGPLGRLS
jgi:hypothetical protein